MNTIDYAALVKKSPLNLSSNSEAKFTAMLQQNFTESEMQLFVANMYCQSRFSKDEFPIDLKFIGFANKGNAKRLLENKFSPDIDYKIALLNSEKRKNEGGFNDTTRNQMIENILKSDAPQQKFMSFYS